MGALKVPQAGVAVTGRLLLRRVEPEQTSPPLGSFGFDGEQRQRIHHRHAQCHLEFTTYRVPVDRNAPLRNHASRVR